MKWFLSNFGNARADSKLCRQIHFCCRQQVGRREGRAWRRWWGTYLRRVRMWDGPVGRGWAFQGLLVGCISLHPTLPPLSSPQGRENPTLSSPRSWELELPFCPCCCLPSPHHISPQRKGKGRASSQGMQPQAKAFPQEKRALP